jgi:hypothetical protein
MLTLRVGQVFHLWCAGCRKPNNKFHVLSLIVPRPRFFIVNSAVPAFQQSDPDMAAHQVLMKLGEHPFFRHDSHMDCTELLGGPTGSDLEDLHAKNSGVLCGIVSVAVQRNVRRIARDSILLPEREKTALLSVW